jgi:hypothetical protein
LIQVGGDHDRHHRVPTDGRMVSKQYDWLPAASDLDGAGWDRLRQVHGARTHAGALETEADAIARTRSPFAFQEGME